MIIELTKKLAFIQWAVNVFPASFGTDNLSNPEEVTDKVS